MEVATLMLLVTNNTMLILEIMVGLLQAMSYKHSLEYIKNEK
jgi:hypothetical protein